jgi:hypothetical protein
VASPHASVAVIGGSGLTWADDLELTYEIP